MSATDQSFAGGLGVSIQPPRGGKRLGPITRARQRRTYIIYAALCALGMMPVVLGWSGAWQAAGLGLWFPGGGFLAVGGWATLLFPLTFAVFVVALVAWFAAGMIIAPAIVWLGTAALAGWMAGPGIAAYAPYAVPLVTAATIAALYNRTRKRVASDLRRLERRQAYLPKAMSKMAQSKAAPLAPAERELTPDQLTALRYILDRALQPIDKFDGFDRVDQFQTAAIRYQINAAGYALSTLQANALPNFHGYLAEAQRNLIEKYLERRVWNYWIYETAWGHLNLTDFDPGGRDNIMLTAWYGLQVCMYMLATGDMRYAAEGSLPFKLNRKTTYSHDARSLIKSVYDNTRAGDFTLYPCEPNWLYPVCNHYGMASMVAHDALFGTNYARSVLPGWLEKLDSEFTDSKGSIIGLRSQITGLEFPFLTGEIGFAGFTRTFSSERADRMWAIARTEIGSLLTKDADGLPTLRFRGAGIDTGNYRKGHVGNYGGIVACAREFGDLEFAEAAQRGLDESGGLSITNGTRRYLKGSNGANMAAATGMLRGVDDYMNAVTKRASKAALEGPLLAEASYPDVLVAKAFSNGDDLQLVLYPGKAAGQQTIRIERLRPDTEYTAQGADVSTPTVKADPAGKLDLVVALSGRTAITLSPASRMTQ